MKSVSSFSSIDLQHHVYTEREKEREYKKLPVHKDQDILMSLGNYIYVQNFN